MTTWKELKDQPIWILTATVVASISLTSAVYEKFLVPARDPNAAQRVSILQSHLDTSQKLLAEIPSLQKRAEKAEAELADQIAKLTARATDAEAKAAKASSDADQRVRAAQWANTFANGSAYPIGLEQVRVGDPIDKLEAAYPGKITDTDKESFRSFEPTPHAVFDRVTYYFASDTKERRITHIVFWSKAIDNRETPDDWLKARLSAALGEPKAWRDMHYSWENKGATGVFIRQGRLILIKPNARPGGWPQD